MEHERTMEAPAASTTCVKHQWQIKSPYLCSTNPNATEARLPPVCYDCKKAGQWTHLQKLSERKQDREREEAPRH